MLVLGHVGIALGVGLSLDWMLARKCQSPAVSPRVSRLAAMVHAMDYRLVLFGSMLPDIIDKPLGIYLFGDTFDNGRIFAHTLVFLFCLFAAGLYRWRRYVRADVMAVAFGCFMHLVLDQMWGLPRTLLWPAFGLTFPRGDVQDFEEAMLEALKSNAWIQATESVGFAILLIVAWTLWRKRRIRHFLRTGLIRS